MYLPPLTVTSSGIEFCGDTLCHSYNPCWCTVVHFDAWNIYGDGWGTRYSCVHMQCWDHMNSMHSNWRAASPNWSKVVQAYATGLLVLGWKAPDLPRWGSKDIASQKQAIGREYLAAAKQWRGLTHSQATSAAMSTSPVSKSRIVGLSCALGRERGLDECGWLIVGGNWFHHFSVFKC